MGFLRQAVDVFIHLDKYLNVVIQSFGSWSYLVLFIVIFCETGLVVTPFLPGDSLLFACGAFAAIGSFNIVWLFALLAGAAVIGDSVNYAIGNLFGEKLFQNPNSKIFKREYLERTHRFYEKYGGKTIVIARFIPIIRTFAPFVAGLGKMSYGRFLLYNVTGGLLWVAIFVLGGYYFGNLPLVKKNFTLVIMAIIFLSILPAVIEAWKHRTTKNSNKR